MIITVGMNHYFGSCYSGEILSELFGSGRTVKQVATLKKGLWRKLGYKYRCWILWRVIASTNKPGMREALARMLERVLLPDCDPRSLAVVGALHENKITKKIRDDAKAAAGAARKSADRAMSKVPDHIEICTKAVARAANRRERTRIYSAYVACRVYHAAYACACAAEAKYDPEAIYTLDSGRIAPLSKAAFAACSAALSSVDADAELSKQLKDLVELIG